MKLRKSELAALVVTAVFLAVTAGYQLGLRHDPPEVRVSAAETRQPETDPPERSLPAAVTSTEHGTEQGGRININTAGVEQFAALDGIGDALAERIVADRTENGPFERVEDIMRVSGIGSGIFEKNRDRLTVE